MKLKLHAKAKRNYKDALFRMIFSDKDSLLSLYNAISETQYTDPSQIEVITLQNAIYINMKNDLAFVIHSSLHMYEHQSTDSPNMPLRQLFYVVHEFEKLVCDESLYSSKLITLPSPYFVVFYNGKNSDWSEKELKLSDCFRDTSYSPRLELLVREINLNFGKSDQLLMKCKPLLEYMQYIEKVRTYSSTLPLDEAVELAVTECIKEGILRDFLIRFRSEVIFMSILEFDMERDMKCIRRDECEIGRAEGRVEGKVEGLAEGKAEGRMEGLAEGKAELKLQLATSFIKEHLHSDNSIESIAATAVKWFQLQYDEALQLVIQLQS